MSHSSSANGIRISSTGQVILRGEFANPTAELLPGMYVRVQIEEAIDAQAITVPVQAVQRNNAGGSEVYAVNDEGRAVLQPVQRICDQRCDFPISR